MGILSKASSALDTLETAEDTFKKGKELLGNMNTKDVTNENIPIHTALAASYGWDLSEPLKGIDDELKKLIAAVIARFEQLPNYEWNTIVRAVMDGKYFKPKDNTTEEVRSDSLSEENQAWFKFKQTNDPSLVNKVHSWFTNFIADDDVLKDTKIDVNLISEIYSKAGAVVDSFITIFRHEQNIDKTFVDVGVLRYPDIKNSFFKLYRIQIRVWVDLDRYFIYEKDKKGLEAEFHKLLIVGRDEVLNKVQKEAEAKAIARVNELFKPKTS